MTNQAMFRTTKPTELPEGFVLDEPNAPSKPTGLPEGFILDKEPDKLSLQAEQQLKLIDLLKEKLPLSIEPTRMPSILAKDIYGLEIQREKAYNALISSGITKEQIQTVQEIQRRVEPGIIGQIKRNIGEDVGGTVGGIAGAKLALVLGQAGPQVSLPEELITVPLAAGVGAWLGGGAGKLTQQTIDPLGSPSARDFLRSANRQGLYEVGGRYATAGLRHLPMFEKPVKELAELTTAPKTVKLRTPIRKESFNWQIMKVRDNYYKLNRPGKELFGTADTMFAERELDLTEKITKGIINVKEAGKVLDDFSRQLKELPLGFAKEPVKMTPTNVAEIFKSKDGFFTPKQRDKRILIGASEELSRGSFGGGAIFGGFEKAQQGQALETAIVIANSLADDTLKTPHKLGDELFDMFVRRGEKGVKFRGRRQALLDEFFTPLYNHAAKLSPNTVIPTEPIKKFMERKLTEDIASGGALLTREGRSKFRYALKNLKPNRTLEQFIDLRSSYLKDARKFAVGADKSEAVFTELAGIADKALFDPTTTIGMTPEGSTFLRNVNAVYGPSKELFDETFIRRIISRVGDSPTEVLSIIYKDFDPKRLKGIREILVSPVKKVTGVGTTERSVANELRVLRRSLGEIKGGENIARLLSTNAAEGRSMWKQLNAVWFAEQVKGAFDPSTGILNIKKLDKIFNKIPSETFRIMFPGTKGKAVKDVVKLFNAIAPGRRGFVSMFGKTFELGGIAGMGTGLATGSGLAVTSSGILAISPTAFAALATNPKATKYLTMGFKAKRGSIKIAPIAARLINILNEDIRNDQLAILRERRSKRAQEKKASWIKEAPARREFRKFGGSF